jgi:hypothetical protein
LACPKCGWEKVKYSDTLPPLFFGSGNYGEPSYGTVTCGKCGTKLGDAGGGEVELADAQLLFRLGLATGSSFRTTRKALRFRAQDLAKLLQVRAETISHWETRGDRAIDLTAWAALGALLEDCIACRTTTLEHLRAALNPVRPKAPVKIFAPIAKDERVFPGESSIPQAPSRTPPAKMMVRSVAGKGGPKRPRARQLKRTPMRKP